MLKKQAEELERLSFFSYMADAVKVISGMSERWCEMLERINANHTRPMTYQKTEEEYEAMKNELKERVNRFIREGGDG